jgi:hypothetical protein
MNMMAVYNDKTFDVNIFNLFLIIIINKYTYYNTTPWLWSASELYQPSFRHLLGKLVPTFVDRGCCMVGAMDSHSR